MGEGQFLRKEDHIRQRIMSVGDKICSDTGNRSAVTCSLSEICADSIERVWTSLRVRTNSSCEEVGKWTRRGDTPHRVMWQSY